MHRIAPVAAVSFACAICSCGDGPSTPGAPPVPDVRVVLTWSTPGDPDETDTGPGAGSNMDLHLMLDGGAWLSAATDCYSGSMSPDWGVPGDPDDDPSLDVDDADGAGPETVALLLAGAGATYHIGVHYVADNAYGASTATVKVYVAGVLRGDYTSAAMTDGQFWRVADIDWSGDTVTTVNVITPGVP